jgi:hypothetical protein
MKVPINIRKERYMRKCKKPGAAPVDDVNLSGYNTFARYNKGITTTGAINAVVSHTFKLYEIAFFTLVI